MTTEADDEFESEDKRMKFHKLSTFGNLTINKKPAPISEEIELGIVESTLRIKFPSSIGSFGFDYHNYNVPGFPVAVILFDQDNNELERVGLDFFHQDGTYNSETTKIKEAVIVSPDYNRFNIKNFRIT